jgi:ribosomal protein L40E
MTIPQAITRVQMTAFKVCVCCGAQHGLRKRVCRDCRVPALWREPTATEQAARDTADETSRRLLAEWIAEAKEEQ